MSISLIAELATDSSASRSRPNDLTTNVEHNGRLITRPNESHHKIDYQSHECSKKCIQGFAYEIGDGKNENPLSIPMLFGWSREVAKRGDGELPTVIYCSPCGRRIRNMDEVHQYVCLTGSQLGVDFYSFESCVHCFNEFEPEIIKNYIKDCTEGKENVRVSAVNSVDCSGPPSIEYRTKRVSREGVDMNLDPNFLICCDCTDDCQDKNRCQCQQLTIQTTASGPGEKINPNAGYYYRRLVEKVITGVYECNSLCKCHNTCLNRVAQRPLQSRLQVFQTERRGWGVRCLDDIPQGQFICVYVGEVLSEPEANEDGMQFGDEYFVELDLIETVEQAKDGYESDAENSDQLSGVSNSSYSDEDSDSSTSDFRTPERIGDKADEEKKSTLISISSSSSVTEEIEVGDYSQIRRELFGPIENCYVIDAKKTGNIGRYLNHSCEPNVFVQTVFVDTHDLRFPWIGFFALTYIRAGTELTWDYMYQIDSVPGKVLICHCGAKRCRKRLL